MNSSTDTGAIRRDQGGSALIMALFVTIFTLGIVITGSTILKANQTRTETQFLLHGQAVNFARSGLTEALNWFRRQDTQPVVAFAPVDDPGAIPPVLDTEDEEIGLVREFNITGNIWGRYEVWKKWDADPDSIRLAWRQKMEVRDISDLRDVSGTGAAWSLKCVGYVYRQNDGGVAYNVKPNQILASEILSAEITRLTFALPGQAALCTDTGSTVDVGTMAEVLGGGTATGIYYPQGTGSPTITGTVTGVPATSATASYDGSVKTVFGVTEDDLRSMAHDYITDPVDFPVPVPDGTLQFVEVSTMTFDASRSLSGSGIVFVKGNVTFDPGSNSLFSGLLYVDGNLSMSAPAEIQGAVIVTGSVTMIGSGDKATIDYNETALDALQTAMGSYRLSRSIVRDDVGY